MGIIIQPNIEVPNIVIQKDENDEYGTDRIMNEWGKTVPIIQIGDYVVNPGELISFDLYINLNNIPTFEITIDDENYYIREALKNEIDKCIIFIGYKEFYLRFNGLIKKNSSDIGGKNIYISGEYFYETLYTKEQKAYNEMTVLDVLKSICESTKLGLYVVDNPDLNKTISTINTEKQKLLFLFETIKDKTTNIFSLDTFGFLHVGEIDKIKQQPLSKYTLKPLTGEKIPETDIVLTSTSRQYNEDTDGNKIPIKYYTLNSNFSRLVSTSYKGYGIKFSDDSNLIIEDDKNILDGEMNDNTFSGFENANFPFYTDIINKKIIGNSISIKMENLIFELCPFDMVNFECYLPAQGDKPIRLDEEHSGKKMILSYSLHYNKTKGEFNKITQVINLI